MIAAFAGSKPPRVVAGSPEWRAALFGQAISYAGHLTGEICPFVLERHLWNFVGQTEEECSAESMDAVLMLIRCGLFTINTVDPATGDLWFSGDTKLTVTPMLTAYLYGGPDTLDDDED